MRTLAQNSEQHEVYHRRLRVITDSLHRLQAAQELKFEANLIAFSCALVQVVTNLEKDD